MSVDDQRLCNDTIIAGPCAVDIQNILTLSPDLTVLKKGIVAAVLQSIQSILWKNFGRGEASQNGMGHGMEYWNAAFLRKKKHGLGTYAGSPIGQLLESFPGITPFMAVCHIRISLSKQKRGGAGLIVQGWIGLCGGVEQEYCTRSG